MATRPIEIEVRSPHVHLSADTVHNLKKMTRPCRLTVWLIYDPFRVCFQSPRGDTDIDMFPFVDHYLAQVVSVPSRLFPLRDCSRSYPLENDTFIP